MDSGRRSMLYFGPKARPQPPCCCGRHLPRGAPVPSPMLRTSRRAGVHGSIFVTSGPTYTKRRYPASEKRRPQRSACPPPNECGPTETVCSTRNASSGARPPRLTSCFAEYQTPAMLAVRVKPIRQSEDPSRSPTSARSRRAAPVCGISCIRRSNRLIEIALVNSLRPG